MSNYNFMDDFMRIVNAKKSTYGYKDDVKMDVAIHMNEYLELLDDMWSNYMCGDFLQIGEYNRQVTSIKESGCKVLRNSAGKHKIIVN